MNPRKNKFLKRIWFESEKQYKKLINSIETGDRDLTLDILYKIYKEGDL